MSLVRTTVAVFVHPVVALVTSTVYVAFPTGAANPPTVLEPGLVAAEPLPPVGSPTRLVPEASLPTNHSNVYSGSSISIPGWSISLTNALSDPVGIPPVQEVSGDTSTMVMSGFS